MKSSQLEAKIALFLGDTYTDLPDFWFLSFLLVILLMISNFSCVHKQM